MPGPRNKKKQKGKGKKTPGVVGEVGQLEGPFMHDPGNGPRVRDIKEFMRSSFAQAVGQDELCRKFGQQEVLKILETALPEDTALILWYNKSRTQSRICPACLRLYKVGDELAEIAGRQGRVIPSGRLLREQELSGLCSAVCFVVASIDSGEGSKWAWGQTGDSAWAAVRTGRSGNSLRDGLGLVVKMTRLDDLGLV